MMRKFILAAIAAIVCLSGAPAQAQLSYPTGSSTVRVVGNVPLQCNAAVTACTPATVANPQPVSSNPYPAASTALAASSTGAAAALTATLTSAAAQTAYLSGFVVSGGGAVAGSIITVTVTGVVSGPMNFKLAVPAGATVGAVPLVVTLPVPLAASAANTNIVVNVPSFGVGNTDAAVSAWGYRQ